VTWTEIYWNYFRHPDSTTYLPTSYIKYQAAEQYTIKSKILSIKMSVSPRDPNAEIFLANSQGWKEEAEAVIKDVKDQVKDIFI